MKIGEIKDKAWIPVSEKISANAKAYAYGCLLSLPWYKRFFINHAKYLERKAKEYENSILGS